MAKMKDVAKATGYNISTVSRALRGCSDISKETIQSVRRAAARLGYRYRSTEAGPHKIIGVILPEVGSHYYAEIAHTLSGQIREQGHAMLLNISGFPPEEVLAAYEVMLGQEVQGIIVHDAFVPGPGLAQRIIKTEVPTVMFTTNPLLQQRIDTIYTDPHSYMALIVDHLVRLGHREIGYVGEHASDVRYEALCSLLGQKNITMHPEHVKRGGERFELGGYLRTRELLGGKTFPTAIVACYDQVAMGAMRALREAGVSVPKQVSLVGIDNVVLNDYLPVGLTSVTNPASQMAIVAVKLLMDNIRDPDNHVVQNVALQSKLVLRSSTAAPRESQEAAPGK